jgi:hypothetical protein
MTVSCHDCGTTWPRHPATEVPCPHCNAAIGSPCRRPSGHPCSIHVARDRLALTVTGYMPCPTNGGETASMAAQHLLIENDSLTNALTQLDLTRADLQRVAQGKSIEADGQTDGETHQPASDTAAPSTNNAQPSTQSQSIQTTLTDMR